MKGKKRKEVCGSYDNMEEAQIGGGKGSGRSAHGRKLHD